MKPLSRNEIKKFMKNSSEDRKDIDLVYLLQSFESGYNVGHMFRLADALGVSKLFLTGRTPTPPDANIELTSMGQENRIEWEHFSKAEECLDMLKGEGYQIVGLELTKNAEKYTNFNWGEKVCIVLGNENDGIYPSSLSRCDGVVYIPMFGKNYSLNVHVAAAIVGYQAVMDS